MEERVLAAMATCLSCIPATKNKSNPALLNCAVYDRRCPPNSQRPRSPQPPWMHFETNSLSPDQVTGFFRATKRRENTTSAKGIWCAALRKAGVSHFRFTTCATRLSAGGVADEWVVQLLRQGNSDVFKKYSQMKLTMKREALQQINRRANEMTIDEAPAAPVYGGFGTVLVQ